MKSKECSEKINWQYFNDPTFQEWCSIINKRELERLKDVEKDLKQTKLNFKNSQTHSRNCYKKLLDRYMGLEKENEKLKEKNQELIEKVNHFKNVKNRMRRNCKFYEKENEKLKKVVEMFVHREINTFNLRISKNVNEYNKWASKYYQLTQQEYELLKEVLQDE